MPFQLFNTRGHPGPTSSAEKDTTGNDWLMNGVPRIRLVNTVTKPG